VERNDLRVLQKHLGQKDREDFQMPWLSDGARPSINRAQREES
jgi:hypothetical protein